MTSNLIIGKKKKGPFDKVILKTHLSKKEKT